MTRWIPWAFVAAGLLSAGCSKPVEGGGIDQTSATGAGGSDPGSGGAAPTSGGAGGGGGQGGQGAGTAGPCGIDCSTIQTPACFEAVCDEASGTCAIVPTPSEPCDDGLFCTVNDACSPTGVCVGGGDNDCEMQAGECEVVVCSEANDSCALGPKANGSTCTSDDLCIVNATCQAGQCVGASKDCFFYPVPDSCKVGACNPATGNCEAVAGNEGVACSDSGDLCMVGKTCQGGFCVNGTPKNCSAFTTGCNNGLCDPGTGSCYAEPVPPGGTCAESTDACNVGVCDAAGQCIPVPANDGAACDDGNACTIGEICGSGTCAGGQTGSYTVYFTETFASNAAGWTFVAGQTSATPPVSYQDWAIGPAVAWSSGTYQDPAQDHSPTADNGLAGVVIGGTPQKVIRSMNYLESPVINTDVPGPVHLEFWRFLQSDYTPYMQNSIEVYNGTSWVVVWQSGSSPGVKDTAWTKITHDLTAHKNANMKIRFGFNIGSTGVFTVGSWSVDDVVIANAICN